YSTASSCQFGSASVNRPASAHAGKNITTAASLPALENPCNIESPRNKHALRKAPRRRPERRAIGPSGGRHSQTGAHGRTRSRLPDHRKVTILGRNFRRVRPEQDRRQLRQGPLIDLPLELDDRLERYPVLTPAPGVELRMPARPQRHVGIATRE